MKKGKVKKIAKKFCKKTGFNIDYFGFDNREFRPQLGPFGDERIKFKNRSHVISCIRFLIQERIDDLEKYGL